MIKVIRPGYIKETMCSYCRSILEYDANEDVKEEFATYAGNIPIKYIICPICGKKVIVEKGL